MKHKQQGFGIVAALFIVVVLATLAGYLVNISGSMHSASSMTQLSTRAYYAARSGLEWGLYQAISKNPAGKASSCAASSTFPIQSGGFSFSTTVSCTTAAAPSESGNGYSIFTIRSTSTLGNATDFDYVARTVFVSVTNAP